MKLPQNYNQKGISPIVLVVVLAIIGIGGFLFYNQTKNSQNSSSNNPTTTNQQVSTKPDDMSTWEMYTNKTFKFTLKYPPGWKYAQVPDVDADSVIWFLPKNANVPSSNADGNIPIVLTFDPAASISVNPNAVNNYKAESYKVGILQGIHSTGTLKSGKTVDEIAIHANGFWISTSVSDIQYEKQLDQILSTFTYNQ